LGFCIVPLVKTGSAGSVPSNDVQQIEASNAPQLAPLVLLIDDQSLLAMSRDNPRAAWMIYVISGRPPFTAGQSPRNGSGSLDKQVTERAITLRIQGASSEQVESALLPLPSGSHENIEWTFQKDAAGTAVVFRSFLKNESGEVVANVSKPFWVQLQQVQGVVYKVISWKEID
jgi:hypothetical protein